MSVQEHKKRSRGLKQKIILFVVLFFLVAVSVSSIIFSLMYRDVQQQTLEKTLESVAIQKKEEIEAYFENLETMAYEIGYSSWMQALFENNTLDERTIRELAGNIEYFLGSMSEMNGNIRLAAILKDGRRMNGPEGAYLDYSVELEAMPWYEAFQKSGKYIETGTGNGIYTRDMGWYMNLYYPINNRYSMEEEGTLVITILEENIKALAKEGSMKEYIVLEDEKGEILSSNIPFSMEDKLSEYRKRVDAVNVGGMEWSMQTMLDEKSFQIESQEIWIGFAVVLILLLFLFAAGAAVFSGYLISPILSCRDAMVQIRNNHMGIYMENDYKDELGELIDGFNEMSASISDLIEKNKVISILQKETEYQMLQQQINPHFLYNTLEIINGLILCEKEEEAIQVCENLGQVFHYNLNQSKWITAQEELRYLRKYLMIMKYKVPNLSVIWEIQEGIEEKNILKAICQPIIENCIKHGFREKAEDCSIVIQMKGEKQGLFLSIMDNGKGMSREKYIQILKELQDIRENPNIKRKNSVHIGIQNIFHRLYLEYEEKLEFHIITKEGSGTRFQIYMPEGEFYV